MKQDDVLASPESSASRQMESARQSADGELFQPDIQTAEEWMELGIRGFLRMVGEDNPAITSELDAIRMSSFIEVLRPFARQAVRDLTTTHAAVLRKAYNDMKADKTEIKEAVH